MCSPLPRRILIAVTAVAVVVVVQRAAFAATMSSTNYQVQADTLNIGGNTSTSTNYIADDSLGELATGEDLTSTNYAACSGFLCAQDATFLTFSVTQGTAAPGTAGAGVAFGTLTPGTVASSDGSAINSIFMLVEGQAAGGINVTVVSDNAALARVSQPATKIDSATADLSAAASGYGICVDSVTQDGGSPTTLTTAAPYNGTCDKTTNHNVGIVDGTSRTVFSSTGSVLGGSSEVLVKAKASVSTGAGSDYQDTLTFIATGTY